jgi:hypothetical protein
LSYVVRPLIPGAGPHPVVDSSAVTAVLPDALSMPEVDLIRDALVDALTALMIEWQYRSDYAAALVDPIRAVKQYLAALANDKGTAKAVGEDDEALRARAFQQRSCVTEGAIIAGVNLILSLVTVTECQLNDATLDRWFLHDGTDGAGGPAIWHSFVGAGPNYPDRYFADDAVNNGGYSRPNSEVHGARLYSDAIGRHLLLRVPDFGFQLLDAPFVYSAPNENQPAGIGFFVGDGSDAAIASYINSTITDPIGIYQAIGNFMNNVCGQSIRWEMLSDLEAA